MINWQQLGEAVEFYKGLGFEYVETPWFVPSETCMITCPSTDFLVELKPYEGEYWALVGSAEQGFLQRVIDNALPGVNYVSCGPCFRNEPVFDEWHHPQFMKVELFSRVDDTVYGEDVARELLDHAHRFMKQYTELELQETDVGWDLTVAGIEVGSYGFRTSKQTGPWAYGTGLAEPRFTQAMNYAKTGN